MHKDFILTRIMALLFTIMYFGLPYIMNHKKELRLSDTVGLVVDCMFIFLPIVIMLSWYMCAERYLYMKFKEDDKYKNKQARRKVYIWIIGMVIGGIILFDRCQDGVYFIFSHWKNMNELYVCAIIKNVITIVWLLVFIYIMKRGEMLLNYNGIENWKLICSIICIVLVFYFTCVGSKYANDQYWYFYYEQLTEQYYAK